jgi:hypothetical protein
LVIAVEKALANKFAKAFGHEYRKAPRDSGYDFMTADGGRVIEIKGPLHGIRDLQAAVMRLTFLLTSKPAVRRATLVSWLPRVRVSRVREEWGRIEHVLRPTVAERLGLVVSAVDGAIALPESAPDLTRLLHFVREDLKLPEHERRAAGVWFTAKFNVWKVLVDCWLRREPPVSVQEIQFRSGCSHPTVGSTLDLLERYGELRRASNRSAELVDLPRRSLDEILVLSDGLRRTQRFIDASGRKPDAAGLQRRILRAEPRITFGGIIAARYFVPDFDLNGLPRIDVIASTDDSLEWLRVDPALREAHGQETWPVLVVHRDSRPDARVQTTAISTPRHAGPAETLLDLHDLKLTTQAEQFVRTLTERGARSA